MLHSYRNSQAVVVTLIASQLYSRTDDGFDDVRDECRTWQWQRCGTTRLQAAGKSRRLYVDGDKVDTLLIIAAEGKSLSTEGMRISNHNWALDLEKRLEREGNPNARSCKLTAKRIVKAGNGYFIGKGSSISEEVYRHSNTRRLSD